MRTSLNWSSRRAAGAFLLLARPDDECDFRRPADYNMFNVLGWDIGGANVKAARIERDRPDTTIVRERPFALWREPHRLSTVLRETAEGLGSTDRMASTMDRMAITMTAELADCFASKRDGVAFVLDQFHAAFPKLRPWVYGVDGRFRTLEAARLDPYAVAAANWMASATIISRLVPDALFVDVGSTTTDVIAIVDGKVCVRGRTDPARLSSGELVYTGVLRTPICAIVKSLHLPDQRHCRVAAEHFAIAADAYRWLGRIDEHQYTCDTPDGRGRTREESAARLSRMICADYRRDRHAPTNEDSVLDAADVTAIAEQIMAAQVRLIASGIRQVRRRLGASARPIIVLAGQGTFLGCEAANTAGLESRDLASEIGIDAARATPAYAVARLLAESQEIDLT